MVIKPMESTAVSVGKAFGIPGAEKVPFPAVKQGHDYEEFVPAVKKHIFDKSLGDFQAWLHCLNEPLMIQGPTGCGKSSMVSQIAARTNRPLFRLNVHNRTEMYDFVGQMVLENGSTRFKYGPLALAMKIGAWILVDEIDLAQPGILAGLNTVLEGGALCIPENGAEVIKPAPGFRFIATCNTKGDGGASTNGAFGGAFRQNAAFMDRFMVLEADYAPARAEIAALESAGINNEFATKMVKVASSVRNAYIQDDCSVTFSTRTLLRWALLIPAYQNKPEPTFYALERALLMRVPDQESRDLVRETMITEGLVMEDAA
jgi:cobaltochelatase CobS